jgi:SAM-dependent methyltransferase
MSHGDVSERNAGDPRQAHQEHDRALFDRIADGYYRKDTHPSSRGARRHRIAQSLSRVTLSSDWDVLEVGCGAGLAAKSIEGMYRTYRGVDHCARSVEHALCDVRAENVEFKVVDFDEYNPGVLFNLVFMVGALHHFYDPASTLTHAASLLKPGGWLLLNEPQPANPLIRFARRWRKTVDRTYSKDQVEISQEYIERELNSAGLVNVETFAQGILSTPFAEVVLRPQFIIQLVANMACYCDRMMESLMAKTLRRVSWNLIAIGQRKQIAAWPDEAAGAGDSEPK